MQFKFKPYAGRINVTNTIFGIDDDDIDPDKDLEDAKQITIVKEALCIIAEYKEQLFQIKHNAVLRALTEKQRRKNDIDS